MTFKPLNSSTTGNSRERKPERVWLLCLKVQSVINWKCRFNCDVSLWTLNPATFYLLWRSRSMSPFIYSAAFELSQTCKAKYLHSSPCLFNVKGTLALQSKWMKTLQTKHLQQLMSTRPLHSAGPTGSTSFSGHGRQWPRGLLGGLSGEAQPCWHCCLCEKRRCVHLELDQPQRD